MMEAEHVSTDQSMDESALSDSDKLIDDVTTEQNEIEQVMNADNAQSSNDFSVLRDLYNTNNAKKCPFSGKDYAITIDGTENFTDHLYLLLDSDEIPGDCGNPMTCKPEWLDTNKFERGRAFYETHTSSILMSNLVSLFVMFSFPGGLQPLVFTGESDTPVKAFKRYLSTTIRVMSWYFTDIWDPKSEGHKNLKVVRFKHQQIRQKMNSLPRAEAIAKGTLEDPPDSGKGVWCPLVSVIRNDFTKAIPESPKNSPYGVIQRKVDKRLYLSQGEMAVTQMAFMGLALLYPEKFGIFGATEEDWEGFVHFWRAIGYLLGIDDKFNFCKGTVDETRRLTYEIMEHQVKPSFRDITRDFEHMSRVMMTGSSYYLGSVTYETFMTYLGWVIGVELPGLWASMTFFQRFHFWLMKFLFAVFYRIPWFVSFSNKSVRRLVKKTNNRCPRIIKKYENKVYTYESDLGVLTTSVR